MKTNEQKIIDGLKEFADHLETRPPGEDVMDHVARKFRVTEVRRVGPDGHEFQDRSPGREKS